VVQSAAEGHHRRIAAQTSGHPNSDAAGKSFSKELPIYEQCKSITLTSAIARDYTSWGAEQITDRQKRLAKLALLAWPIDI
jgi:hypothetical protein